MAQAVLYKTPSKMNLSLNIVSGNSRHGILSAISVGPSVCSKRNNSNIFPHNIKPSSTPLKVGRGGRSSFSGIVATVFGATGFLGPSVINRLGKIGSQVIIPYRCDFSRVRKLKVAGDLGQILFTPFDMDDEESIRRAVRHSNVVINLVGRNFETKNFPFDKVHVECAHRIAKISKEMGVEKFLHLSALNGEIDYKGYATPGGSKFLKSKFQSEAAVRSEFPEAIIFRPSDIWGQRDNFFRYYLGNPGMGGYPFATNNYYLPYAGVGIWKQPVASTDVAIGIINAITDPNAVGQSYDIAGPRRYELCELIDYMMSVIGRDDMVWQYRRADLKDQMFGILKRKIFGELLYNNPIQHQTLDRLERECVTDTLTSNPTLVDLGVDLTILENVIQWEIKMHSLHRVYTPGHGEFAEVELPHFVPGV